MKERIEHSLRLAVVTSMVVGRPQLGIVSNTARWPRATTIRATVAARITMAPAAQVEHPANQAPVIMVITKAMTIMRPRSPRRLSTAMAVTVPMRKANPLQKTMCTQTGSNTSTNIRYMCAYAVLIEALRKAVQQAEDRP
ncbi:hypothetical protein F753_07280 [Stutzerimonas chloritidismutans AW-1]|uniref:Uncharacterized protein n=3 Tax=Stutzerimonas stutzeri group TaxID=136846 RepID=A0A8D4C8V6_9GAMM|nr:hypothetical protein CL52_02975 [Stutzerimonas balearica DSM 6083]ESR00122.1 hypothetical protein F753_07280 [Stutzerimonas chloritidismutans AW-1]EWC40458.1 hypothetical protein B597_015050 [Stutzerimonas stutzeri KOS6]KIL03002.1 hypothetical protein QX25_18990 [Stutzerimonas stutzeri]